MENECKECIKLRQHLKDARKQAMIDIQKMIMGNAYCFKEKNNLPEYLCQRIKNMMPMELK